MPELRCKPGQMAMLVRASRAEPCSAMRLGVPVTVERVIVPRNLREHLNEVLDGPMWLLAEPLRCPHGHAHCPGIEQLPDACLRPFDPESAPEPVGADTNIPINETA